MNGGFGGLTASVLSSEYLHFDLVTGGIDACESECEIFSGSRLLVRDAGPMVSLAFSIPNVSISEVSTAMNKVHFLYGTRDPDLL